MREGGVEEGVRGEHLDAVLGEERAQLVGRQPSRKGEQHVLAEALGGLGERRAPAGGTAEGRAAEGDEVARGGLSRARRGGGERTRE